MEEPIRLLNIPLKRLLLVLSGAIGIVTTILVLCGFVPHLWLCDLASNLRILYAILLSLCLVGFLLLRSRMGTALIVTSIVVNALPILFLYDRNSCRAEDGSHIINILNFNTEFKNNEHYGLLRTLINERTPNIVALVEVNQKWIDAIEPATRRYRYSKILIEGPGMAFFSQYPIERCDVKYFGRSHHPRIVATVRVEGQPVRIIMAHPTTPKSEDAYFERNQELVQIRGEIADMPDPKLLIGDLNCGPWSSDFYDLLKVGMRDSQQGLGPQPSWPARNGRFFGLPIPPLVPIDHVLVSNDICVLSRNTGPAIGSDHLPVSVSIALPK